MIPGCKWNKIIFKRIVKETIGYQKGKFICNINNCKQCWVKSDTLKSAFDDGLKVNVCRKTISQLITGSAPKFNQISLITHLIFQQNFLVIKWELPEISWGRGENNTEMHGNISLNHDKILCPVGCSMEYTNCASAEG